VKRGIVMLLVLVVLGSIVSPVVATTTAKMKPIPTTKRTELHKNINIVKVDPEIKNATPHWIIIVAGSTEKGRSATFKYIDSSTNLTKEEKIQLKKFVKELWRKYHVKTIKDGNTTLITPSSKTIKLTQDEEAMLEKIAQAVNEYFREKYSGDSGEVGILWNVDTHQSIIYISCKKWGVDKDYCNISRDHADDPDFWPHLPSDHYYNPDTGSGSAPYYCWYYAYGARSYYRNGDMYNAFQGLGWSSHFLTDVGNPLHTGREADQALHKWVHTAYEDYVSNNWESGYNFKSVIEDNWYYYAINDPWDATENLASYSHYYLDTLYLTIYNNPDTWQSSTLVRSITEDSLLETAKYALGLVKYVTG